MCDCHWIQSGVKKLLNWYLAVIEVTAEYNLMPICSAAVLHFSAAFSEPQKG